MEAYLARAMRDYERSLKLTKAPLITYQCILGISMLQGREELSRRMLDASIRIDPKNFVVRYKYLGTLQTRWGGSLEAMIDFERESRAAGLTEAQLAYFTRMIATERRWLAGDRSCCSRR